MPQFEVLLTRKPTALKAGEQQRRRNEPVTARNEEEARRIALTFNQNHRYFDVLSIRRV